MLLGGFLSNAASGQSYGPFEWDVLGFSFVMPSGEKVSTGLGFYTEPRYNISDDLSLSLRFDLAVFGSDLEEGADVGASTSMAVFGDYYFSNNKNKRGFAGLGAGTFGGGSLEVDSGGSTTSEEGGFGFGIVPRVGYELGFIRLALEYNLAFAEKVPNYLALKLGFNFGGRYNET